MSERAYRAVLCRADEAAAITRASQGEFHPALSNHCCPHLDVFHNHGQREDGSHWRACTFLGCECDWEDEFGPAKRALHEAEKALNRTERREAAWVLFMIGAACGLGLCLLWMAVTP